MKIVFDFWNILRIICCVLLWGTWQLCLFFKRQYFQVSLDIYFLVSSQKRRKEGPNCCLDSKITSSLWFSRNMAILPPFCEAMGARRQRVREIGLTAKKCHKEAEKLLRLFGKFPKYKLKKTAEEIYKFKKINNRKDKMQQLLQANIRLLIYGLLIKPPLCLASTWECWGAGGVSGLHPTLSFGLK